MQGFVGKRIREEREHLGLSQEDLARLLEPAAGLPLQLIESGQRRVDSLELRLISVALGVPMDAFFDAERGEALASVGQSGEGVDGMDRMTAWGLELLADMEFAERTVSIRGW